MTAARVHVEPANGHVALQIEGVGTETLDCNAALYVAQELQRAVYLVRQSMVSSVLADVERGVG